MSDLTDNQIRVIEALQNGKQLYKEHTDYSAKVVDMPPDPGPYDTGKVLFPVHGGTFKALRRKRLIEKKQDLRNGMESEWQLNESVANRFAV